MTLTLDVPSPLVAKLKSRAAEEGCDEADIAIQAMEQFLEAPEQGQSKPTIGAQILAQWEAEDVLGIWQDRPESTEELAAEFRRLAESRGPVQ
jgi:hypothetical protein